MRKALFSWLECSSHFYGVNSVSASSCPNRLNVFLLKKKMAALVLNSLKNHLAVSTQHNLGIKSMCLRLLFFTCCQTQREEMCTNEEKQQIEILFALSLTRQLTILCAVRGLFV